MCIVCCTLQQHSIDCLYDCSCHQRHVVVERWVRSDWFDWILMAGKELSTSEKIDWLTDCPLIHRLHASVCCQLNHRHRRWGWTASTALSLHWMFGDQPQCRARSIFQTEFGSSTLFRQTCSIEYCCSHHTYLSAKKLQVCFSSSSETNTQEFHPCAPWRDNNPERIST